MGGKRWIIAIGAILAAAVAIFVLLRPAPGMEEPLDDIDAASRAKMRELLRDAE